MIISNRDKDILRELAKKQWDYSQLPIMEKRIKNWTNHNDLNGEKPMIHVELWTFKQDLLPELICESEAARQIEKTLYMNISNHEQIDDDRVVSDFYPLEWNTQFHLFNLDVKREKPREGGVGHQFIYNIRSFPEDLHKLKSSVYTVDRRETLSNKNLLEDIFGDILPVKMVNGSLSASLSQKVVHLMGMEAMIFAIMDYPDEFHSFMSQITDDYLSYFKWKEDEELFFLNNGDNILGQGSFGFTNSLPRRKINNEPIKTTDLWAMLESQETLSLSPDMFDEFFFPYYNKIAQKVGLISYGCCEPVHSFWEKSISRYPNLRKISISPWCDEEYMGEALQDSGIIYHRKPSPNYMGLDKVFDEKAYRAHILKTLKAAKNCKLEFSFRDVYTLCGEIDRPRKMVRILREMIEDNWV